MLAAMKRSLAGCVLAGALAGAGATGTSGCVTTAAIARPGHVSLPLLAGAVAADLTVVALAAAQAQGVSAGAAVAIAIAVTATDTGAGCILGACGALRP